MSADFSDEQMKQFAKMSSVDEVDAALGNKEAIKSEFQSIKEVERLTAMVEDPSACNVADAPGAQCHK